MAGDTRDDERARRGKPEWPFVLFLLISLSLYLGLLVLIVAANVVTFSWDGVWRLLQSEEIRASIRLTLVSCTITAILSVLVAVPVGYFLSRNPMRGRWLLGAVVDIPILLPPLVVGLSLLILFNRVSPAVSLGLMALTFLAVAVVAKARGVVGWLLGLTAGALAVGGLLMAGGHDSLESALGGAGFPVTFHPVAVVLAQFPVAAAFAIRTMQTTFDEIDPRFEEVAMSLGCHRGQAFSRVVLPMAGRGMVAAGTMAWARALGEFGPVLVFAGAMRGRTEVLSTSIFLEIETGNLAGAAGIALVMIVMAVGTIVTVRVFLGRGGGK